jgi:tRNA(Leu) C34 or U34 (ribose-2'-O)-methylase TrmL
VLLDGVQDPGNVGSILRSAGAAGIKQVWCSPGTAFCWSPKVLRAAMGAHFVLEIFENADLPRWCATPRCRCWPPAAMRPNACTTSSWPGPVAWMLGHEGQGVSDDVAEPRQPPRGRAARGPGRVAERGRLRGSVLFRAIAAISGAPAIDGNSRNGYPWVGQAES